MTCWVTYTGGGWVTGEQPMVDPIYQGVKYDYTGVYG
jgi:hypothetical protein